MPEVLSQQPSEEKGRLTGQVDQKDMINLHLPGFGRPVHDANSGDIILI